MNWTDEDVKLVEKFIDIRNRGYYCDGTQLTEVYNRVLDKRVNPTNCGSCIRQRVNELEEALNRFKRSLELEKKDEPVPDAASATQDATHPVKEEENNKPKTKKK